MMLHTELAEQLVSHYGARLTAPPQLAHDALTASFDTGVAVELRFASDSEYSLRWAYGDAELRIDTAPLHPQLATYPNHLHDADGQLRADPLTIPGRLALDNLCAVLDAILQEPLLESRR